MEQPPKHNQERKGTGETAIPAATWRLDTTAMATSVNHSLESMCHSAQGTTYSYLFSTLTDPLPSICCQKQPEHCSMPHNLCRPIAARDPEHSVGTAYAEQ